jgi:hypothetical protein
VEKSGKKNHIAGKNGRSTSEEQESFHSAQANGMN